MKAMDPSAPRRKRLAATERRKQILEHTLKLIARQGFKTVSVRDIAASAGINEALIYKYFSSKDELLQATISELVDQQPVQPFAPAASLAEFRASLGQFVDFFLERNLEDPSLTRMILYAAMEDFPLPDEFNIHKPDTFLNWLYRSIQEGQASWGLDPGVNPLASLSQFMGGLVYFILEVSVLKTVQAVDVAAFKKAYVDSFLRSLSARQI
jgi:AcrR family transcriptional regulator